MVSGTLTALAVLFLAFRWRGAGFDWRLFGATLFRLDWGWVFWSALLGIATYYGRALRWSVMLKPLRSKPNIWRLFSATAIGFTAVVIFGRPGEFVRPYLISVKEKVPFTSQLAAWLLERACDLLTTLLIFGFALSQVNRSAVTVGPALEWVFKVGGYIVAVSCLLCLLILILFRHYAEPMRRRLLEALGFLPAKYYNKSEEMIGAFAQGVEATRDPGSLTLLVIYTLLEWALITGSVFCLLRAFPGLGGFRIADVLIFLGFVSFGSVIQLPGIGGGTQIVSVVVLTELFGMPLELASSVALGIWIITFVVIVPVGTVFLFHEGLSWQKLKDMEAEASL